MTTTELTPEYLAELERLAEAATPGEWKLHSKHRWVVYDVATPMGNIETQAWQPFHQYSNTIADSEFIAAARAAVPALCIGYREQQKEIADYIRKLETVVYENNLLNAQIEGLHKYGPQLSKLFLISPSNGNLCDICSTIRESGPGEYSFDIMDSISGEMWTHFVDTREKVAHREEWEMSHDTD